MRKANNKFTSYHDAVLFMGDKVDRPYGRGRSTRIVKTENGIAVRYHNTNVVTYTPDGIILNTGGWFTLTTKSRINEALAMLPGHPQVWQSRGVWSISVMAYESTSAKISLVFFDGMVIGYDGRIVNLPSKELNSENLAENKRRQKLIKAYVKTLRGMLESKTLPAPSGGDCWYCSMVTDKGIPLGEATDDHDHLLLHLEESYIVPSLVWYVTKTRCSQFDCGELSAMWAGKSDDYWRGLMVRNVTRAVSRYLKNRLGVGA